MVKGHESKKDKGCNNERMQGHKAERACRDEGTSVKEH